MREKRILMDIDHTLSDAAWRDTMLSDASKNGWDEYHSMSRQDKSIEETAELAFSLRLAGYEVIGLTARPERWRTLTMEWLLAHHINLDGLLMRPNDNYQPSPDLKLALALASFPQIDEQVSFIIDDRDDVAAAFVSVGVHALQITKGRR